MAAVPTDQYGPFNTGPGGSFSEVEWGHLYESLSSSGVSPKVLNEFRVTQRAAGVNMSVDVASGQGFVHGHMGRSEAVTNLPITANPSGSTRYDRVVIRSDRTRNITELDVLLGSAGVLAALTQNEVTWESHIAQVTVAVGAASISNANILYVPDWAAARTSAPSALVAIAGTPVALPTGVSTVLNLTTPLVDTGHYWDSTQPARLTVGHKGLYLVGAQVQIDKSNGGVNAAAAIGKGLMSVVVQQNGGTSIFTPQEWKFNTTPVAGTGAPFTNVPDTEFMSWNGPVSLVAGNYIEMAVFQLSGVPMRILNGELWIVDLGVA